MGDTFSQQVYQTLSQKADEELLGIWKEQDTDTWSSAAFAAIERIAGERGLELKGGTPRAKPPDGQVTTSGIESPNWETQPFSALVAVGRIFAVTGWLLLLSGLAGSLVLFVDAVSSGNVRFVLLSVGVAALVFVQSIFLIGAKDLVALLLSMEEQLRRIADRGD